MLKLLEKLTETRHKEICKARQLHTRKFSRASGNLDLKHRLLESSDPLITSLRAPPITSKRRELPDPVIILLTYWTLILTKKLNKK